MAREYYPKRYAKIWYLTLVTVVGNPFQNPCCRSVATWTAVTSSNNAPMTASKKAVGMSIRHGAILKYGTARL